MSNVKKKLNEIAELLITERAFYLLIMVTMISLPICELLVEQHERNFEGQPIIVEAAGILGIVMVVLRLLKNKGPEAKFYLTDVLFFFLVLFAGLSLAYSEDMLASTRGYDYDEWLTHFMAYFSLMYAGTMVKDKKLRMNILKAFIFVLVIHGFVGILQSFGMEFTNCFYDADDVTKNSWTYGLTPHFNWFSALMTLAGGCAMGMAVFAKERKRFCIFTALTAVAAYVLFCTEARLSLLSVAVLLAFYPIALLIYNFKNKESEFFRHAMINWVGILLTVIAVFALCYFVFGRFEGELDKTMNELNGKTSYNTFAYKMDKQTEPKIDLDDDGTDDSSADSELDADDPAKSGLGAKNDDPWIGLPEEEKYTKFDAFATGRGHIWKFGLACVPDHWAFGVGLDNYRWCFTHAPNLPHDTWSQGKGHNELIHYLVTQGVFQLLTILTLIVYTFIVGIRTALTAEDHENRLISFILVGMVTAYFVQSMFNSSVVNIAPYYWIAIGMVLCQSFQRPFGYRKSLKAKG